MYPGKSGEKTVLGLVVGTVLFCVLIVFGPEFVRRLMAAERWVHFYVLAWCVALMVALGLLVWRRRSIVLFGNAYWRFLSHPWKLGTFAISGATVTFLGPYTSDPTWDWVDGGLMSILAFTTAPWSVATIYRFLARKEKATVFYAAVCVWLFSASWCYDAYLLWRDGFYPATWSSNIMASSVLYCCAGLFWNLDWIKGKGTVLAFREPGWPQARGRGAFSKILWIGLPFMALVAWMILVFLKR